MSIKYGDLSMNVKNKAICDAANRLTLTLLTCGHARIGKSWRGVSVNRTFSFLYYIYRGGCVIKTEKGPVELVAGRWYLIPSGCNFEYYCEDMMEHIYFHIELSREDRLDITRELCEPIYLADKDEPSELFRLVHTKDHSLITLIELKARVLDAVTRVLKENGISPEEKPMSECVLLAISYITKNPIASLTTGEIAANAFVSKSKLTKQFRRELSMSVQEYLYNILLSEATRLLINTELAVSEISERLGFSDQFYFSRKFKQKYGLSPRAYKARAQMI